MKPDEALVQARIPQDLNEWIGENFPHGFRQVFILQCFTNLRSLIENGGLPPQSEYSRQATVAAISRMAWEDLKPADSTVEELPQTETEETS
jgi:hypothetical protein